MMYQMMRVFSAGLVVLNTLLLVTLPTTSYASNPKQEQTGSVVVRGLESSCGGVILPENGVFSDGYGVWLRGAWNGSNTQAIAVQYEAAPGGNSSQRRIIFLRYPATESPINVATQRDLDRKYHAWRIVGSKNMVQFFLDGKLIGSYDEPASGNDFGFRTWRGRVEVKNLKISDCSRIVNDQTAKLCSSLEPQVQSVNISGIWKEASSGYVYKINQTGNEFTWAVVSPIRESARGSISGNLVVATYNGDNGVATVPGTIVLDNRNRASEIRWNNGAVFRRQ
jgi:hypothetical protein